MAFQGTVRREYARALNSRFVRVHNRSEYPAQPKNPKGEILENIPAGFRARETYLPQGTDAFEEVFELAEPNKPFEVYSRTRFTRVKER